MDRLDAMRVFVAVVEGQGFSAAARALGIPLATVSRRIAELEEHLGAQLLIRSTRKVAVTDSGRQYCENARRILENLADAEAQAAGEYSNPRGQLSITAPALFGRLHLLPVIRDFMAGYPDVTVRLLLSNFVSDLMEEHIDLGVRIGKIADTSLIAMQIGSVRQLFCASPSYLAARGMPLRLEDLAGHDCITFSKSGDALPWAIKRPGQPQQSITVAPRLIVTTAETAADATIAGGGVTWLYAYQAAPHLAAGTLRTILMEFEADPAPVSIVYPAGRLMPQKVRRFIDLAAAKLRAALIDINRQCNAASASKSGGARTK